MDDAGLGQIAAASWALFWKDLRVELRTRYALNALAMFVLSTVLVTSFYLGPQLLRQDANATATLATLLWIAILFAALTGLARAFVGEEEAQTTTFLRLYAPPLAVFWSKWLVNAVLLAVLMLVATFAFGILTALSVGNVWTFGLALCLGGLGLASATTIVGAIIAQASARSALFAALAIPVLFPLLLLAIETTESALAGKPLNDALRNIIGMGAFGVALTTASALLFPFVWEA